MQADKVLREEKERAEERAEEQERILQTLWGYYRYRYAYRRDPRRGLAKYEAQLQQLEEVTIYRGMARNIVLETHQDIDNMLVHLTELKEAIGGVATEEDENGEGVEGAQDGGKGEGGKKGQSQRGEMGIPLEVHIDAIMMGIKRLVQERDRMEVRFKRDLEMAAAELSARNLYRHVKKQPRRLSPPRRDRDRKAKGEGHGEKRGKE